VVSFEAGSQLYDLHAGLAIRCRYLIMPTGVIRTECVNKLKFYFYHVQIFYIKDITDKKVAGQNQGPILHVVVVCLPHSMADHACSRDESTL
jgi:hypothetical protein